MKTNLKFALTIIILAAAVVALWFFVFTKTQTESVELPAPQLTKTARPQRMNLESKANWIGKAQARQKATIIALTEGAVEAIDVNDEASVNRGATLLRLGGPVIETRLHTAKEKVSSLQIRLNVAQSTLTRKQRAVSEKVSSLDELASAQTAYEQDKAELESAKEQLQLLVDSALVTAPIGGIFTNRKVNVGQTVEKGDELAEIIVPGRVRIVATVLAAETSGLEGRQVTFNAPDGKPISGTVVKVMPELTAAGSAVVWIESKEIDQQIAPGQNLSGKLIVAVHNDVLAVPASSVVYDENDVAYVFLKADGKFEKKQIRVGFSSDGWVEIVSGVTPDDQVVTEGAYELYYRDFNKSYKVPD
jgi:RND family efflux transporter MFP subunit